jgi:hypothetical protein
MCAQQLDRETIRQETTAGTNRQGKMSKRDKCDCAAAKADMSRRIGVFGKRLTHQPPTPQT